MWVQRFSVVIALLLGNLVRDASAVEARFIGSLTCTMGGGQGFVFGRTRNLSCIFEPIRRGGNQAYKGYITRFGQELAAAQYKAVLVWSVFSKKAHDARPLISGRYTGVGKKGAITQPTGMYGLTGGLDNRYFLEPVRNEPNTIVNFGVAIGEIELRAVRPQT